MMWRIDQGISDRAVLLFGFERGKREYRRRGGGNVEIAPYGDFQGRWEESEIQPLVFLAFHGPPFPRPSSRPKYACSPRAGELELALLPTSNSEEPNKAPRTNSALTPDPCPKKSPQSADCPCPPILPLCRSPAASGSTSCLRSHNGIR